jgi:hypothetical protein
MVSHNHLLKFSPIRANIEKILIRLEEVEEEDKGVGIHVRIRIVSFFFVQNIFVNIFNKIIKKYNFKVIWQKR